MKVVGVMLVRNEVDLIELNARYHLSIGIDEILVVDNGSTDGTSEALASMSRSLPILVRRDEGPYSQSELTTELARTAYHRGATWVLPTDADEFWWSASPIRAVLSDAKEHAFSAPVINFVQRRRRRRATTKGMLTMTRRVAEQVGPPEACQQLVVERKIGFVEMEYTPKWITRASPDLVIHRGNHAVSGFEGERGTSREINLLHAPLRAREVFQSKAEQGRRVLEGGFGEGEAWHVKRWAAMNESELDEEWAANSTRLGQLHVQGRRRPLVRDLRLRQAVHPLLKDLKCSPCHAT